MAGNWCRAALTAATATLALARFEPSFERGQPSSPLSLERSNEIFETFLSRYYTSRLVHLRVEQFLQFGWQPLYEHRNRAVSYEIIIFLFPSNEKVSRYQLFGNSSG